MFNFYDIRLLALCAGWYWWCHAVLSDHSLLLPASMMVQNGMTRYNNDLVRRKDKVKARKADNKTPIK
jgi:hypothetical protein